MKRILLAGIALGVLAAPAMAADMYVKAPAPYPYLWNGFYAGLNAGYADEQSTFTTAANPTSDIALGVIPGVSEGLAALSSGRITTNNGMGFIGGGQVGYNMQLGKLWMVGLEADIQGKTGTSNGSVAAGQVVIGVPVTSIQTVGASTDWLGTVRGRFGIAADADLARLFHRRSRLWRQQRQLHAGAVRHQRLRRRRRRQYLEYPHRRHLRRRPRMDVRAELERQGRVPLLRSRHRQLLLYGEFGLLRWSRPTRPFPIPCTWKETSPGSASTITSENVRRRAGVRDFELEGPEQPIAFSGPFAWPLAWRRFCLWPGSLRHQCAQAFVIVVAMPATMGTSILRDDPL